MGSTRNGSGVSGAQKNRVRGRLRKQREAEAARKAAASTGGKRAPAGAA